VIPVVGDVAVAENHVRVRRTGQFGVVAAEVATPLVMVLTELVQNAVEHAFPPGASGEVVVSAERSARWLDVSVTDDGRGLPRGFSLERSNGLGLQIVRTLVESELRGSLSLRKRQRGGTEAQLRVPLSHRR
jgi:two-component sensor histidine kinase